MPRSPSLLATAIATVSLTCGLTAGPAAGANDPRAVAIADQVMTELGGKAAWDATRYLHFGFGQRQHWWDKWEGRYRLQGTNREGHTYLVLMDLDTRQGSAWLDGAALAGEALTKQLESAYGAWVNDTYWLLMPYKLQDPGVNLAYGGEEKLGDATYDKLQLSFDHVGLTPGDRYWAYINRATHRMDRWAYVLESEPPDQAPTGWAWLGWQRVGKILLAPRRQQVGGDRTIILDPTEAPATLADSVFTDPKPLP